LPVIDSYPNLEEVYWVQEEPSNMGAWEFVAPLLNDALARRWPLHYVGRPRSSSPAEGSSSWHAVKQEAVLKRAFGQKVGRDTQTIILEK
ncbi:hypothetical protein, partial [Pseudomonas aeruginosa]